MITNFVALNSIRPKILKVPVNRTWVRKMLTSSNSKTRGGYFGVKRIGMTVGNPRKLP